jgi:type I restriction enzyme S subunit
MPEVITNNLDLWTSALLTKSTAGRGSNGKLEAYGIKKLRVLILELAVRGNLVPQDPNDEPASVLLERAREENGKLITSGKAKREKALLDITDADKPFDLPKGWIFARLGDLFLSIKSGGTPSKQNPAFWNGEIPWASVKDLGFGEPISTTQDRITVDGLDAGSCLAETGSIIICTRMGLGKIGESLIDVAINQDLKAITLTAGLIKQYFINYYKTVAITGTGMTVAGIKQDELLNFIIPFPPFAEQHRIVAKVDQLMVLCDQLEQRQTNNIEAHQIMVETLLGTLTGVESQEELSEAWTRIANHFDTLFTTEHSIDQLKQTLLQLAVMGKLVHQDPNDEPAEELYSRIHRTREQLVKNGAIKRASVEPNPSQDSCDSLPIGWLWTRLGNVFDVRDGTHDTPKYTNEGFPLITSKNIYTGRLSFEGANFISEKDHRQICERSRVDRGDILFAMIGSIGNPVIVDTDREFSIKNVALFKYYAAADADPRFLLLYLNLVAEEMREKAAGGVQSFVSLGFLRNYLFPLPPLAEQHRIVAKVDELMDLCDALKARINDAQTTQIHLADAIVDQAIA